VYVILYNVIVICT